MSEQHGASEHWCATQLFWHEARTVPVDAMLHLELISLHFYPPCFRLCAQNLSTASKLGFACFLPCFLCHLWPEHLQANQHANGGKAIRNCNIDWHQWLYLTNSACLQKCRALSQQWFGPTDTGTGTSLQPSKLSDHERSLRGLSSPSPAWPFCGDCEWLLESPPER